MGCMSDDDHQLLKRALDGDEASFTTLYRRRQAQVYRFAFHTTGSESAAEDITQETFLTLFKTGVRFDPERASVLSFLYGIARNQVLRLFERRRLEGWDTAAEEVPGVGPDAFDDMTRSETIAAVRRAVVSLPPQYREVVVLCDLEGESYEDAATAIDCPVGTVRSRLSRARELLGQKLRVARRNETQEPFPGVARSAS